MHAHLPLRAWAEQTLRVENTNLEFFKAFTGSFFRQNWPFGHVRTKWASTEIWGPLEWAEDQLNEPGTSWLSWGDAQWKHSISSFCQKGWLPRAKLRPLVEVVWARPIRSQDFIWPVQSFGTKLASTGIWPVEWVEDQLNEPGTSWLGWEDAQWKDSISSFCQNWPFCH